MCFTIHRTLSNAARGPDSDLGMLTLNAPSNSPTVAGSPSKRGRRRKRGKKEKEGSGGIMTTDDLLHDTSIELVCTYIHIQHVCIQMQHIHTQTVYTYTCVLYTYAQFIPVLVNYTT